MLGSSQNNSGQKPTISMLTLNFSMYVAASTCNKPASLKVEEGFIAEEARFQGQRHLDLVPRNFQSEPYIVRPGPF